MPWLCLLLLFCSFPWAYSRTVYFEEPLAENSCIRDEFIEWSVGVVQQTRSVNLSMCGAGSHKIEILRPLNSCKHIRARIVSHDVDDVSAFKINVIERGTGMDKTWRDFNRKNLRGANATVVSSPFTYFKLHVNKTGLPSKAEVMFQFTIEEDGCPYPFLDVQSGTPIEVSSKMFEYECDFTVTANGPGEVLAFSLSPPLFLMRAYEDYSSIRPNEETIDAFDPAMSTNFIPIDDLNVQLKTSRALIHLSNSFNRSIVAHEERLMVITTAIDDCSCNKSAVIVLDIPNNTYSFKLEKLHCYHVTCLKRVQIDESLRSSYRLHVWPTHRRRDDEMHFAIRQGNSYLNLNRMQHYYFSNYELELVHNKRNTTTVDSVEVSLIKWNEEARALCACPIFGPLSLTIDIDGSCPRMDCLWTLKKKDITFGAIQVFLNTTSDLNPLDPWLPQPDEDQLTMISRDENGETDMRLLRNDNVYALFPGDKDTEVVIHYRRTYYPRPASSDSPYGYPYTKRRPEYYGEITVFDANRERVTEK